MSILTEEAFKNLCHSSIKKQENPKLYEDRPDAFLCYIEKLNEKICIGYGYELNARDFDTAVAELKEAGFSLTAKDSQGKNFSEKLYDFYENKSINYIELNQWIIENASTVNLTKSTCDKLFENIFPQYIKRLNDRINKLIPSSTNNELYNLIKPEVHSNERGALLSLVYNNPILIGKGLAGAIITNNRAEAWYEIRYNSHGGASKNLPGIAERRIEESNMFSLYGTENPTEADFCSAYIMYQKHRSQIETYENTWSQYFSNQPNNIQSQLSSAYKYLTDTYASGNKTIAWNQIYIGDIDNNQINKKGTGNALVIAGAGNDTINAGAGNDILIGGAGSDKLTGGSGCDTYKFNLGDGYDTIIESFNEFNVIEINAYSTTFEAFYINNDIMLRSTSGGNHIRIKGSSNFEIRFSDTTTTLSAMLEGQEELPDDTLVPAPPFQSGNLFVPASGTKYIYLPDNFNGVLDLSDQASDIEIFGVTDDTVILLPEGTEPETGSETDPPVLKGPEGEKIKPTPAPGSDGGKGIYIVGQGPASTPDDNNGDDDPPKRGWKPVPGGSGKGIMSRIKDELSGNKKSIEEIRSPLAIDLDGDGVETVSVDNGVYFDHDGNGFAEKTGWISADDAILVRDLNNNGQIDNGSELFGDQTILSNGEKAANGFEALADLDSNHDGVFDGDDEAFGQIKVWQDLNQNGVANLYSRTDHITR